MCGIVGAAARRDIVPILVEGLRRLEYRGYDSCGVAVLVDGGIGRVRSVKRVADLAAQIKGKKVAGATGIAHTRWATHGAPVTKNAHPMVSTTKSCAPSCRPPAIASKARPTPRSSRTSCTASTRANCSRR